MEPLNKACAASLDLVINSEDLGNGAIVLVDMSPTEAKLVIRDQSSLVQYRQ